MPAPFDSAICPNADLPSHISRAKVRQFVAVARQRGFPLPQDTGATQVLTHLQLIRQRQLTNAAILLFGREPHSFFPAAQVCCYHFAGAQIDRPLASQAFQGSIFELVDQATDFVLSRINDTGGYEIPAEAVREAIVNAIAHRDYNIADGIGVRLFSDRLEIHNPTVLSKAFDPALLRQPHFSMSPNQLVTECLYLANYIKEKGTGTTDIIALCRQAGLPQPRFLLQSNFWAILPRRQPSSGNAGPVVPPVHAPPKPPAPPDLSRLARTVLDLVRLLGKCGALGNAEILQHLGLKDRINLARNYLNPALKARLIERTIPDKPRSRSQRYRLTAKGKAILSGLPKA